MRINTFSTTEKKIIENVFRCCVNKINTHETERNRWRVHWTDREPHTAIRMRLRPAQLIRLCECVLKSWLCVYSSDTLCAHSIQSCCGFSFFVCVHFISLACQFSGRRLPSRTCFFFFLFLSVPHNLSYHMFWLRYILSFFSLVSHLLFRFTIRRHRRRFGARSSAVFHSIVDKCGCVNFVRQLFFLSFGSFDISNVVVVVVCCCCRRYYLFP